MLKKAALATGIVFLVIGILGFIPALTSGSGDMQKLFGIFMVNAWHNWVHIVSGIAFLAASGQRAASRLLFQVMAVVYGIVTILGFIFGTGHEVFGFIMINTWDNFLHLVLTLAFVYFGFMMPSDEKLTATSPA